ncbi:MAG: cytochrome oxidase subunit [Acidimicrobiales bacterium]|nr:cytochrome oxidase subunit [Acidimicrobiales bacterium]
MPEHHELPTEVDRDERDQSVAWRMFVSIGAFVAVMAAIYWFTTYERAGSVMLTVSAILSLWAGTYLWLHGRRPTSAEAASGDAAVTWLPHASAWPLGIGLAFALILNGLLIGVWFLVPGVTLLAISVMGFAMESRRRD